MPKRRGRKKAKISTSPSRELGSDANGVEDPQAEKDEKSMLDVDVKKKAAALRAIRDSDIDHLRTSMKLLRSNFSKEQLQTPVCKFFEENLPNLSILRNENGQFDLQWKDKDGKFPVYEAGGSIKHASILHQMSMPYFKMPSFSGIDFSSQADKTKFLGANDLQIRDCVLGNFFSHSQTAGLQTDAFQTPGANSSRLSIGVTPKTYRMPKHGEMLLSAHGSPLGVYKKEDNMEAICEAEES